MNVKTNIGKKFLDLLDNSFPKGHILHQLLNRQTVKISYRTMPNIKQIIASHNKKLLNSTTEIQQPGCNCRKNKQCPLQGHCLTTSIIYQATVTRQDNNRQETYIGLTANDFKERYNQHTSDFRHNKDRNSTALSKYIWTLKDNSIPHNITWKIIAKSKSYSPATNKCNICF